MNAGRSLVVVWVVAVGLFAPGVGAADGAAPDSMPLPPPAPISYSYDAFYQSLARPLARSLDPSLLVRKLGVGRREAANVDERDRVLLPSTWWQPRIGFKPLSVEEMVSGPGPGTGPAPGPWKVTGAKSEGVSRGFTIQDSTGARFAIKFDVPGCSELGTSADVVVSKLLWAAGYNVPDNAIAFFRPENLQVGKGATHTVAAKKVPITPAFLTELLCGVPRQPDGSFRVVASRFLPGKPLDEWRFDGRRRGDSEDRIPHELRREVRGLWAISAWVNHTDCSARNTLDTYVTDGGRSFVRHNLLDFSGCLGSASIAKQPLRAGHEYWVDGHALASALVTLALPPFVWESSVDPEIPGVGFVDSRTFDPGAWRPYLPNPAFDMCTRSDIRWGVRIVAAFTNEHIRAAVEQGRYSDPRATEYLVRILEERRDKLVRRWLPADEPVAARDTSATVLDSADADAPGENETVAQPSGPSDKRDGVGTKVRRAAGNFFSDGWVVASAPFRARGMTLVWAGAVLGTEAVIYANDQEIHDAIVRNRRDPLVGGLVDVGNTIEPYGFMGRTNPYYMGALVTGYALNVRVLRTIPTEILESHFIAGGIRNALKAVVGRRHPFEGDGPYSFAFGQGTSFPSGHTSVAFELATIASMNAHRLPVTIVAYAAATAMATQRIESGNHWPSDVFFAAVYGTLVSRTVVKLHEGREQERKSATSLLPRFSDDGRLAGLQLTRRF